MGQKKIALDMIATAATFCRVHAVKFQKRNNRECLTPEQYEAPHPVASNSYGSTYGEHREFLELSLDDHRELKQACEAAGVDYSTSVWDETSAREIVSLQPKFIKVGSGTNLHWGVHKILADNLGGDIHVSLGMTTHAEEEQIISFYEDRGRAKDLVIYSCTSGYPVPHKDVALLEIKRLSDKFGGRVKAVAFSGHHLGIALDVAAVTLGAAYVERHFTLDRTWKGTDHAASLEPEGMRRLVRDTAAVSEALCYKEKEILDIEVPQRAKLKWGFFNAEQLSA